MAIEMLSYRQLGERLGCSRNAARELVKRLRLPRHIANDGKARCQLAFEPGHRCPCC